MNKDYRDINEITPLKKFNTELSKIKLEFDRKHKPFDMQCAKLEFKDMIEEAQRESERRHGFIKMEDIKIDFGDLEKYGDAKRFKMIDEQPHLQDKVIEGTRTQVLTGYTRDFVCKERGHGISVFIPTPVYEEEKGIKKEE